MARLEYRIYNVAGQSTDWTEVTGQYLVDRFIGDDWRPPPTNLVFRLFTDDGLIVTFGADPDPRSPARYETSLGASVRSPEDGEGWESRLERAKAIARSLDPIRLNQLRTCLNDEFDSNGFEIPGHQP